MADNVEMNAGSGGAKLAADDISNVYYPRVKIAVGADGTNDGDVCTGNPMPVDITSAPAAVKRVNIDEDSSGETELVAAVAGKLLRVISLSVFASEDSVEVNFTDGTVDIFASSERAVPLDVTGAAGAGGFVLGYSPVGWFETAAVNRPIKIELSAAKDVCGCLTYVEV